jgi:hypothetical protein
MTTQPETQSGEPALETWLRVFVRVHFLLVVAMVAFAVVFTLGMFGLDRLLPAAAAWFEDYFAGAMVAAALAGVALFVIGVLMTFFGYLFRWRKPPSLLIRSTGVATLLLLITSILAPAL